MNRFFTLKSRYILFFDQFVKGLPTVKIKPVIKKIIFEIYLKN